MLLEFLKTCHPLDMIDEVSPLPILGDRNNRRRVDPEESTLATGIYRDRWERKVPGPEKDARRARKDVCDSLDYISWDEFQGSVRRGRHAEREWMETHGYGDETDDEE